MCAKLKLIRRRCPTLNARTHAPTHTRSRANTLLPVPTSNSRIITHIRTHIKVLGEADKFMLTVASINDAESRMKCLAFQVARCQQVGVHSLIPLTSSELDQTLYLSRHSKKSMVAITISMQPLLAETLPSCPARDLQLGWSC